MQTRLHKKTWIKRAVIIFTLSIIIYLLMVLENHPQAVERYYSRGVYVAICYILHPALNLFPFSVGDILYIAVITYLLYTLFRLLKLCLKKQFAQAGNLILALIIGVQYGIVIFYVFWGMNYFRLSAGERLNLKDSTFTIANLQQVTAILIDSANNSRAKLGLADMSQRNDTIYHRALTAINALSATSPDFKTYSAGIKPSLLTPVMNYIGTSGYYNPFTTEAQINYQMPVFNRPFVACHEMSHQVGYGPEDEANFAGYIAATSSKDNLLRYSGYYLAVQEFMHTMRLKDTVIYKQLKKRISPVVIKDFKTERLYWLSYQNRLNVITGIFYDNFLKVNNQPEGLDTYNRMVSLVMAMYKKKGLVIWR